MEVYIRMLMLLLIPMNSSMHNFLDITLVNNPLSFKSLIEHLIINSGFILFQYLLVNLLNFERFVIKEHFAYFPFF